MKVEDKFELENVEGTEYDKRLEMYRNLRNQLLNDLSDNK
jgi:hypothetical protein